MLLEGQELAARHVHAGPWCSESQLKMPRLTAGKSGLPVKLGDGRVELAVERHEFGPARKGRRCASSTCAADASPERRGALRSEPGDPAFERRRASLKWSSASVSVAISVRTLSVNFATIASGVTRTTSARSPWVICTMPSRSSDCSASRMTGRVTPKMPESSRSEGSRVPTGNSPALIAPIIAH